MEQQVHSFSKPTSLVLPTNNFVVYHEKSSDRDVAECAVKQCFRQAYQADISEFLPLLITAQSQVLNKNVISLVDNKLQSKQVEAVVGLRSAASNSLYVEHYLPCAIEDEILQQYGLPVQRDQLVEIGNLISTRSGLSNQLFIILAFTLAELGIEWVTFTATHQVEFLLKRMQLQPITLCEASHAAVANNSTTWGSYYQQSPKVCFGNVYQAVAQLAEMPHVAKRYQYLQPIIKHLVSVIKDGAFL
jgi:hypothetical protein